MTPPHSHPKQPQPALGPPQASRVAWLDLIKALSVLLVVVFHAALMLPALAGRGLATEVWLDINAVIEPLRMPVFFLVSGMLASRAVMSDGPWRQVTRSRIVTPLYLYALWTGLFLVLTVVIWQRDVAGASALYVKQLATGAPGYWYLAALPIFFTLARTTRRVPIWLVIPVAALPNLFRPVTADVFDSLLDPVLTTAMMGSIAVNAVFFLAGARWRDGMYRLADWGPRVGGWWLLAFLLTLAAVGVARWQFPFLSGHTLLVQSLGWICWAVLAARVAAKWLPLQEFARFVGVRSLAIYVIQFPVLFLGGKLARLWPGPFDSPVAVALYPLLVTLVTVVVGVVVTRWFPTLLRLPTARVALKKRKPLPSM